MSVCRTLRTATPFICLPLGGCAVLDRGFLLPAGPVAAATRHEFLVVCLVMLFVIAPVLALAPLFAWHYRLSNTRSAYRPQWGFSWPLEGLIWIPPSLIVVGSQAFTTVLGLGLVQMIVHFRCFLHIDLKRSARADLQLILFSSLIVALMVGGTLVILFNLRSRMM